LGEVLNGKRIRGTTAILEILRTKFDPGAPTKATSKNWVVIDSRFDAKVLMRRREQFLKDLDVKTEREKEQLRTITPVTAALKTSLNLIGNQERKNHFYELSSNSSPEHNGIPCAREGHSANLL
jgi:hypothetical protein